MLIYREKALDFDDISIVPKYSCTQKENVDQKITIANKFIYPIISSPMDTITGTRMITKMSELECLGIHHRYTDVLNLIRNLSTNDIVSIGAISSHKDTIDRLIDAGFDYFCLDVAHGESRKALDTIEYIRSRIPEAYIISGSICTYAAAEACILAGANALRVGVSPGQSCATRELIGVGLPLIQSLIDINPIKEKYPNVLIIGDGGISNSGKFVKAIACGADACFIGTAFGGTDMAESPFYYNLGEKYKLVEDNPKMTTQGACLYKQVRGMASYSALVESNGKSPNNVIVEGKENFVKYKGEGSTESLIKQFLTTLKQAFFYVGAENIKDFQNKVTIRMI